MIEKGEISASVILGWVEEAWLEQHLKSESKKKKKVKDVSWIYLFYIKISIAQALLGLCWR